MNSENPSTGSNGFPVLGVLVGLLLLGAVAFLGFRFVAIPAPVPPPLAPVMLAGPAKQAVTVEQARELLRLKHEGLGHLENDRYQEAIAILQQVSERVPDDAFGPRNVLVAVTAFETPEPKHLAAGQQAADALLKLAPNDALTHLLRARLARKQQDAAKALAEYRRAAELDPQRVNIWYEIYDTTRYEADPAVQSAALPALKQAWQLAPKNLWILLEILPALAQAQDREILAAFDGAAPLFLKLKTAVNQQGAGIDLQQLVEGAQAALEPLRTPEQQPDWRKISTSMSRIRNVMNARPQSQADQARAQPRSLDYIQFEFSPGTLPTVGLEPEADHPTLIVDWQPKTLKQVTGSEKILDTLLQDVDLDSLPELLVLLPQKLEIHRRVKDSGAWELSQTVEVPEGFTKILAYDLDLDQTPVTTPVPMADTPVPPGNGTSVCHKSDADLILFGPAGIGVWINEPGENSQRKFTRAEKSGLEELRGVQTLSVADFDHDGDLDFLMGLEEKLAVYINREGFQFADAADLVQLPEQCVATQIIAVDWDRDVDTDFLVFGRLLPTHSSSRFMGTLENLLHGELRWLPAEELWQSLPDEIGHAEIIDADANATWDLALFGRKGLHIVFTQPGSPTPVIQKVHSVMDRPLQTGVVADVDNNGYLDLVAPDDVGLRVWNGSATGTYHQAPVSKSVPLGQGAIPHPKLLLADYDQDGDLDAVAVGDLLITGITNGNGNQNNWLQVRLRAMQIKNESPSQSKRVNHQGIGSLVELKAGAFYQPRLVTGDVLHFGLGKRTAADAVRILWTNGVPQVILNPQGNHEICEEQAPKGSCPFLYVWNGERFEFFTDLLWNAPIGLQYAQGVLAQPREWEYLKIPGERLHLKDGKHVFQVTEELWESSYFDQIELFAVDHPADVEIYTNEKVGPPSIAQHKIHTVRTPRLPVSAKDQAGRDVLTSLLADDDDFTKCYDRKLAQGLTTDHHIELDLGPLENPQQITLFLTGWMYPTETSINVSLSQNSIYPLHRPPALWVPDANGNWQEIRPFMGFPGGKPKTIAIDLSGVFSNGDHRLRIATNMEFYWGRAFFTVDETPVEVITQQLPLVSAELHYRGRSTHGWPTSGNGPDFYDYSRTIRDPLWPPMQGKFTRYGDVLELLTTIDDKLMVIGSGDEATVTFSPPEKPVPPGWKRDYVIHNVGWDKDADLHTVHGQTVEPLPFVKMSQYPFAADEAVPNSPEFQQYLRTYQTRQQPQRDFWTRFKNGVE